MRIHNDHLKENALIFNQILSTDSLRKCMEIILENLHVDTGVQKVIKCGYHWLPMILTLIA